jgi:diguanylate cyclase (GGDEF)-like protein/PAS domain S-box-containing protein
LTKPVRLLVVDDSDDDAELVVRELRRAGWAPEHVRVDKHAALVKALASRDWDLVVADYSLPQLDALHTLETVGEHDPNLPCVVISGRTGEEAAVEVMQRGARDYVVKDRLARLGPVVERVLVGAEERREKEATERALRDLQQRFHAVVHTAMDAVITVDAYGIIETVNPAAERLFGYAAAEVVGRHVDTLLTEPYGDELGPHFERTGRHKHGTTFPLEISLSETELAGRRIYTWIARDVRERKAFEARLAEQALRDPLTGLANRTLLVDRIATTQSRASRRHASAALLFLDLDRFKVINDRYGHAAGDEVLRVVAKRLSALVRPADTIARLGGDEFVVLCEDIDGVAGAEQIATRIASALQSPVLVSGSDVVVSASIGIAVIDDPTLDADMLLRDADAAMYHAKERGRDRFEIFDHEMRAQAFARTQIEHALHRALEAEQLRLHYQPQRSLVSGELVGFEALLRWDHPERGLLGPAEFLSVADETGIIVPIGTWGIGEACRQAARFAAGYDAPLTMWVNLSARQLVHADLVANVAAAVDEVGTRITLGIEITEDALMNDPGTAIAATRRLRDLGARLAIDDFGTGYSSLHYVKLFPVDTLKIDRSFVQGVAVERQDAAIVSAIVGLSRALGLEVIAEGVETPEQAATLRDLGCDVGQGYHYARPLPAPDAVDLLGREPVCAVRSPES